MAPFFESLLKKLFEKHDNNTQLDNIMADIARTLYTVDYSYRNDISSKLSFIADISFKPSCSFSRLLYKSNIVLNLTYQEVYKVLYDKDNAEDERICDIEEAIHAVGRIPFDKFMEKYKDLVEYIYPCKIIENTYYAINMNVDIDSSSEDDFNIIYLIVSGLIQQREIISLPFESSIERQNFVERFGYCLNELCKFLLYSFYNSISKCQQALFVEYHTNKFLDAEYSVECGSEYMFKSEMQDGFNIEHYIGNTNNREYYFFILCVINELLLERVDTETVVSCVNDIANRLSEIAEISLKKDSVQVKENTYKSSSVLIGSQYDANVLSKLASGYLCNSIKKQKDIIVDYIREEVKRKVSLDIEKGSNDP